MDLVISAYALNAKTWAAAWPDPATRPRLLEWPGVPPAPGRHPSWFDAATKLRGGATDAPLLDALLRQYNISDARRIAAVGFSAGANSGLRELLRAPQDRARFDAVFSIDGIHASVADPSGAHPGAWKDGSQVAGLLDVMRAGAAGRILAVVTSSDVAAPGGDAAKTSWALGRLTAAIADQLGRAPSSVETFTAVSDAIDPALLAQLQALGETEHARFRDLWALWFRGAQGADHIRQAAEVLPLLLRSLLVPRWTRGVNV